ncbi:hypothetical protein [Rhodospirillum sp. A1_3_36]|uniref:hypothetical protein n=1 Tax=Rhodospirillum sp. A1_3_36 TaxID=3391666 RepID=UPI0039A65161
MTAYHVACPDDRDASEPIQVKWNGISSKWESLEEADAVVWQCKEHDVALLRVHREDRKNDICAVNLHRPEDGTKWFGEGFPRDGKTEEARPSVGFSGDAHHKADEYKYFEISVSAGTPRNEGGWAGASGMPIVLNGRAIGVCLAVPENFGNERLHAAPFWQLWDKGECHSPLSEHLVTTRHYAELREKLVAAMTAFVQAKEAFGTFAKHLGLEHSIPENSSDREKAESIVEAMLTRRVEDSLKALHTTMKEVAPHGDYCPTIAALVQKIAPILFRVTGKTAAEIEHAARHYGGVVYSPFGTCTMAEVLVAVAQGRPLDFMDRKNREDRLPVGRYLLPLSPVFGMPNEENPLLTTLIEELRQRTDVPKVDEKKPFAQSVVDRLNIQVSAKSSLEDLSELRSYFEVSVEYDEPLPYMAVIPPKEAAGRVLLLDAIHKLTNAETGIPELFVILLDPTARASDRATLGGLPLFVPVAST